NAPRWTNGSSEVTMGRVVVSGRPYTPVPPVSRRRWAIGLSGRNCWMRMAPPRDNGTSKVVTVVAEVAATATDEANSRKAAQERIIVVLLFSAVRGQVGTVVVELLKLRWSYSGLSAMARIRLSSWALMGRSMLDPPGSLVVNQRLYCRSISPSSASARKVS